MAGCRHIGGMLNDNPERLDRNQRLAKQFRETTPGGRVFLLLFYAAVGIGLYLLLGWLRPYIAASTEAQMLWTQKTFGPDFATYVDVALLIGPLALLFYLGFWRQRS